MAPGESIVHYLPPRPPSLELDTGEGGNAPKNTHKAAELAAGWLISGETTSNIGIIASLAHQYILKAYIHCRATEPLKCCEDPDQVPRVHQPHIG